MSRSIRFVLFGVLVWSCTETEILAQPAIPPAPISVVGGPRQSAPSPHRKEIKALQAKLEAGDLDEAGRIKATADLKKLVEAGFDDETKMMKRRIKRMQDMVDERAAGREKLIKDRLAKLLDPPRVGDIEFEVKAVEAKEDGSSLAKVIFIRTERRTRTVNLTEMVAEQRVRQVDGKDEAYTVNVPVTRAVEQEYEIKIPVGNQNVPVPKGMDVNKAVKKFISEGSDF